MKYDEAKVHGSAIMEDFRDNEKKQFKMAGWRTFFILLVRNLSLVFLV